MSQSPSAQKNPPAKNMSLTGNMSPQAVPRMPPAYTRNDLSTSPARSMSPARMPPGNMSPPQVMTRMLQSQGNMSGPLPPGQSVSPPPLPTMPKVVNSTKIPPNTGPKSATLKSQVNVKHDKENQRETTAASKSNDHKNKPSSKIHPVPIRTIAYIRDPKTEPHKKVTDNIWGPFVTSQPLVEDPNPEKDALWEKAWRMATAKLDANYAKWVPSQTIVDKGLGKELVEDRARRKRKFEKFKRKSEKKIAERIMIDRTKGDEVDVEAIGVTMSQKKNKKRKLTRDVVEVNLFERLNNKSSPVTFNVVEKPKELQYKSDDEDPDLRIQKDVDDDELNIVLFKADDDGEEDGAEVDENDDSDDDNDLDDEEEGEEGEANPNLSPRTCAALSKMSEVHKTSKQKTRFEKMQTAAQKARLKQLAKEKFKSAASGHKMLEELQTAGKMDDARRLEREMQAAGLLRDDRRSDDEGGGYDSEDGIDYDAEVAYLDAGGQRDYDEIDHDGGGGYDMSWVN